MNNELAIDELATVNGGAWSTHSYDGGRVQVMNFSICGTSFCIDSGNGMTCSSTTDSKGTTTNGCVPN